jgi:RNA polymerase sigma-70 factor (ECF subfamily)
VDARQHPDERDLIEALRAGDDAAFERVVREQGGRMLSVARRILRDETEAEEAVQEAFIQLHRKASDFREEARLSTWLHRVVVNAALMRIRKRKSRAEESIDDQLPQFLESGHHAVEATPWTPADEALEQRETRDFVRESIDRLPENHSTVLLLRDIEELSTREAAGLLGLSENAVKVRLHRARLALRELVDRRMRRRAS